MQHRTQTSAGKKKLVLQGLAGCVKGGREGGVTTQEIAVQQYTMQFFACRIYSWNNNNRNTCYFALCNSFLHKPFHYSQI